MAWGERIRLCLGAGLCALLPMSAAQAAILTHHYDFTSGVTDLVGGVNGVLIGATVGGGRLNLDGVNDYVEFGTNLVATSGSFSVAMFAQRDSIQTTFTELISQGSSGGPGFYLGTNPAGGIRAGDTWGTTGATFGAVGTLVHYALVSDATAGTAKLYMDGALVAIQNSALSIGAVGTGTRLGRQFEPFGEFFHGSMDDVRIYTGALTQTEVAALVSPVVVRLPEPGSLALLGAAIAAACSTRRRAAGAGESGTPNAS